MRGPCCGNTLRVCYHDRDVSYLYPREKLGILANNDNYNYSNDMYLSATSVKQTKRMLFTNIGN